MLDPARSLGLAIVARALRLDVKTPPGIYRATPDWQPRIVEFLRAEALPHMPLRPDWDRVAFVVNATVRDGIALIALDEGEIVSSLGLSWVGYWWADAWLLGNVWFFSRPHSHAGAKLLRVARQIAEGCGVECMIQAEAKGKIVMLNNMGW